MLNPLLFRIVHRAIEETHRRNQEIAATMFKCENCNKSPFHIDHEGRQVAERPNKIVVERKMVQHTKTSAGPRGGQGTQIVREVSVCNACKALIAEAPIERVEPSAKEVVPGVTVVMEDLSREVDRDVLERERMFS